MSLYYSKSYQKEQNCTFTTDSFCRLKVEQFCEYRAFINIVISIYSNLECLNLHKMQLDHISIQNINLSDSRSALTAWYWEIY